MRRIAIVLLALCWICCKRTNPPAPEPVPPTQAEAEAFAKQLAKHMTPCQPDALAPLFDVDMVIARTIAGRKMTPKEAEGFRRGVKNSPLGNLGATLCRELGASSFTYLRTRQVDGTPRPLFRVAGDDGVNYHEYELDRSSGRVRIADLYIYLAGEQLSTMLGMMLDQMMASSNAGRYAETLKQIRQALTDKQPARAHELLKTLPEDVRKTKPIMMFAIRATSGLEDNRPYLEVMEAYGKQYPNDPSLDLVLIDEAFLHEKYDQAITLIERLDKRLGGDPYLDAMRSIAHGSAGRHDQAIAAARRATEREPEFQLSWWALLSAQAAGKQFAGAVETLAVLRDRFSADVSSETLSTDERFKELAATEVFTAWSSRQP